MSNYLLFIASALFAALSVADVALSIKLQKLGAVENNPLLGKHPSARKLIVFGGATTAAWLFLAVWLALNGAPYIEALFLLGIFLRLFVVSKGYKLLKELRKR